MNAEKENQSELEQEFRGLVERHSQEIEEKLNDANTAMKEAMTLSEKYGIPFPANISQISQSYTPKSFITKFGQLDRELIEELSGAELNGYYGWEHSDVCY